MLGGPGHGSYSNDPAITASGASTFGVKWMANLFATDLSGPVVAYNSTLKKTVIYAGNERGDIYAIDASNGHIIWSENLGYDVAIRATPAVANDGSVWVGTNFDAEMYKLNGATGAVMCSMKSPIGAPIMGSPMIVHAKGGSSTVYWESIDVTTTGPFVATTESNCAQVFENTVPSGSWATPVYGVDGSGEPLVMIGTSDPGSTEWAYDAITGATVWSYKTYQPPSNDTYDIGEAATVLPAGKNGFADGVVYLSNKYGQEYALDMSTGTPIWAENIYPSDYSGPRSIISSAALDPVANQIVFGYANGLIDLNATTGSQNWNWADPAEVGSSPAIIGPSGQEVVAFGDYTGAFRLFSLSSGSQIYSHQTGGYIVSSPSEGKGTIYITSADGFLYAFAEGGSNATPPSSTVTSPASNTTVSNPDGNLTVSGSSSDASSVSSVEIAVQANGASGSWYDAATGTWNSAPVRNLATLGTPGGTSTTWSFSFPVAAQGGTYKVFANTVNSTNIVDRGAASSFTVSPSNSEPTLHTSTLYVAPGQTFTATGNAFKPGETVTFSLFGTNVATATVGKTGNVPQTKIQVSSTAAFGPTSLTATGNTSGKTSTTGIYVSNDWGQYGYGSLRNQWEPYDPVITDTIDVGINTILYESWMYQSGAAINTEPSVVNEVAFVGNDAGTMTAINTASGSPKWTYQVPSGAKIRSSAVIDPNGNVIFGADDGNLYVLNSSGGSVTTLPLGGNVGSPAYDNGNIVVASDSGNVYSYADGTWTNNWSASTGAAVHSTPAYDALNGVVVVGNDSGTVTAFDSGVGTVRWTATTAGAIDNAPVISNGSVYVGSSNGTLYAYKELTGALEWTYKADSAIQGALDVGGGGFINFGTASGKIYSIKPGGTAEFVKAAIYGNSAITGISGVTKTQFVANASGLVAAMRVSGKESWNAWSYQTGGTVSQPPAILNGTVYVGSSDGNLYAFTPNGATPMLHRAGTGRVTGGGVTVQITSTSSCNTP